MRKTTLALVTLAMLTGTAQAQVYKCTDPATGAVTFSQTRCAQQAESLDVQVSRPSEEQVRAAQARREAIERHQAEQREADRIALERERIAADIRMKAMEREAADRSRSLYLMQSLQQSIDESEATIRSLERLQHKPRRRPPRPPR